MRKPDFFVVGGAKCGTTSLYHYLKSHPQIFMPEVKEPHFFGQDLNYSSLSIKAEEDYLGLFTNADQEVRLGEASVWYLYSESAAFEIKNFSPHAQIIIIVRNPVEVLYSLYNYFVYTGRENILDFEDALSAEEDRKIGLRLPKSLHSFPKETLYYREVVRFSEQILRYFEVFESDQIHLILFDEFKSNADLIYKNLCSFLKVNDEFIPQLSIKNRGVNRRVRSKLLRHITANPFSKQIAAQFLDNPYTKDLAKILMHKLYLLNNKFEPVHPMDDRLKIRLENELKPEISRLSELFNKNLEQIWLRDKF